MSSTTEIEVPLSCNDGRFDIQGLRFEPNVVLRSDDPRETKIISNTGGVVGHFVTHAPGFRYHEYGVHTGQVDKLTFVAPAPKKLRGIFIDCRLGSPSCGRKLVLAIDTSAARKLVIPNGVAHAFEDIEDVVTRNDLELYCDPFNPDWKVDDDNITFPLDVDPGDAPRVRVNTRRLPFAAAIMFYRMQQRLLRGGRDVSERLFEAEVAGARRTIVASRERASRPLRAPQAQGDGLIAGVEIAPNSFSTIAPSSWAVLPTTPNCVMDLVRIVASRSDDARRALHTRHDVIHTFLDRAGDEVTLELLDLRRDSENRRREQRLTFSCDPRAHVRIPAGVAYRYRGAGRFWIRVEYHLFLDEQEPRLDLPPMGADRLTVHDRDVRLGEGIQTPKLPAPAEALWFLMRQELEVLGRA